MEERARPVDGQVVRVLRGFFEGKTVLVTGHTGFQGSWLCAWLAEMGACVAGYSLPPPTDPSMFEELALAREMDDARGDVRDREKVRERVRRCDPDVVIHLAAQALVRRSYREPLETFTANAAGSACVLEALRGGRARPCVVMTSDKCYFNPEDGQPRVETDRLGGPDPYSASKACAELVCASYQNMLDGPVSTVRAGNVIGGGDWAEDRLVPDCARAAGEGRPVKARNPGSVRPWQFVLEPLSALLYLAARTAGEPSLAGPYNVGPAGEPLTVGQMADGFCGEWGGAGWEKEEGGPPEARTLLVDSAKMSRLGWRQVISAREALSNSVKWYKARLDGKDMREFTRSQILEYERAGRAAGARWA